MKAYRDADLFMVDIECIICQTIIPALPSNDIEAAEVLSQKGRELLTAMTPPVSNIEHKLIFSEFSTE